MNKNKVILKKQSSENFWNNTKRKLEFILKKIVLGSVFCILIITVGNNLNGQYGEVYYAEPNDYLGRFRVYSRSEMKEMYQNCLNFKGTSTNNYTFTFNFIFALRKYYYISPDEYGKLFNFNDLMKLYDYQEKHLNSTSSKKLYLASLKFEIYI